MKDEVSDAIERAIGVRPRAMAPLSGGCVATVVRAELPDGDMVVAKFDPSGATGLAIEGESLQYLKRESSLPVPRVISSSETLLILEYISGSAGAGPAASEDAADALAALHEVSARQFGFAFDTVIGGLPQLNPWGDSWRVFFRDHRLLAMATQACQSGALPAAMHARIQRLADKIDDLIDEPAAPSLIHGDVWSGNVLCDGNRVHAFIDPAISFSDSEMELAFIALFSTFGDRFYRRYAEHRPIRDEFFESRQHLYNLYPLLVHVRLFGGHYVQSVDSTLTRFGF